MNKNLNEILFRFLLQRKRKIISFLLISLLCLLLFQRNRFFLEYHFTGWQTYTLLSLVSGFVCNLYRNFTLNFHCPSHNDDSLLYISITVFGLHEEDYYTFPFPTVLSLQDIILNILWLLQVTK